MVSNRNKRLLWITDGALEMSLHKNARIQPAIELTKFSWQVSMISSKSPREKNGDINFIEIGWPNIYFFGAIVYYIKVVFLVIRKRLRFDIVFFQMDSMSLILLLIPMWNILRPSEKIQVVVDYRSLPMDTETIKGKLRTAIFYLGAVLVHKMNLKVTVISEKIAEVLNIKKANLIGVWPSGANVDEFKKCFQQRKFPGKDDPVRFIYLGAMRSERNLMSVVKAADIVLSRGYKITLDFVGSGEQMQVLKAAIAEVNHNSINIEGPFPFDMVPGILMERHIGILPFPNVKKMNVSSAIKMFEYMAAGMPILATDIEAHRRVFKNEKFVVWCEKDAESMAKSMEKIVKMKNRFSELSGMAREFSKNWSWENSAKKLNKAFENVLHH